MKTTIHAGSFVLSPYSVRRLLPVVVAFLSPLTSAAESQPRAAEPKTHTLFMGADILVEQNKGFYRVQDVVGGSFVIKVDGQTVKVPADWGLIKLKVDRSLKLTATTVSVDRLKVERAYTPGNDPVKKFMDSQQSAMKRPTPGDAVQQLAIAQAGGPIGYIIGWQRPDGGAPLPTGPEAGQKPSEAAAEGNFQTVGAGGGGGSIFSNSSTLIGNMETEIVEELFDAIDVEFDVSSGKLLRKPYAVIMAQYRERGGKPGGSKSWLYATALEPLDARPQKIRIRKGGFPPGFVLEKSQVRIYDGGQELATSVSEKQVPMTRNEAFTYLLLDYIGSHKGATQPAAPAIGKLSPEARARLNAEQLKQTYYVKVTRDGLPVAAFADANCSQPVDEVVGSLVGEVRFYPALEKGKTAEGVAELRFSRLAL